MTGIFNGLQSIVSAIQSVVSGVVTAIKFLISLMKSLYDLIMLLITTVGNVTNIVQTLPSWLLAFATATVAVSVLYIILGRETGK